MKDTDTSGLVHLMSCLDKELVGEVAIALTQKATHDLMTNTARKVLPSTFTSRKTKEASSGVRPSQPFRGKVSGRGSFKPDSRNLGAEEPRLAEIESDCPILQIAVGARLIYFWKAWEKNGADPWSVQVLREGYKGPFLSIPPLVTDPVDLSPKYREGLKKQAMRLQMSQLLKKQAIEKVQDVTSPGFYNRLFLVPKSLGEWRSVLDMCFKWLRPEYDVYNGDSEDGSCSAPLLFTKIMLNVASMLHSRGIRASLYLDDWLIRAASFRLLFEGPKNNSGINQGTGPPGEFEKIATDSIPGDSLFGDGDSQSDFSGFSVACENTVSSPKDPSFSEERTQFRKGMNEPSGDTLIIRKVHDSREVAFSSPSVSSQSSLEEMGQSQQRSTSHHELHQVSSSVVEQRTQTEGRLVFTSEEPGPRVVFRPLKLGVGKKELLGAWTVEQTSLHINQKENLAIHLALKGFEKHIRGKVVQINADSTTALAYITKYGGTHSWTLYEIARPLLIWAEERKVTLLTRFISGSQTV
ncbi:uncharacterized protein [Palaemon carinicauda]|uniref:uncharacterized protein n=1 Tax=Palaemon carinicauda TaxID=392227 RepID=UPI0035B5CD6E